MPATQSGVLIRTDGNAQIATGHLMRCLSIARALSSLSVPVHFALADETSAALLQGFLLPHENYELHIFHTDYSHPEEELKPLQKLISDCHFGTLLLDSYFVTPEYMEALKDRIRTVYLDDILKFDYPVNTVINYDPIVPVDFYQNAAHKYVGLSYAPLRIQFSDISYVPRPEVHNIFISTGGTDDFNVGGTLSEMLLPLGYRVHLLTGALNIHLPRLKQLAETQPHFYLHQNVSDVAALMTSCDIAVSAGGTTLYELCAASVPSISYTIADNQIPVASGMAETAGLPYIGDIRSTEHFYEKIIQEINKLAKDMTARKQLSAAMHRAVDGKGALRIAHIAAQCCVNADCR